MKTLTIKNAKFDKNLMINCFPLLKSNWNPIQCEYRDS